MSHLFVLRRNAPDTAKTIVDNALAMARELYRKADVAIEVKPFKKSRTLEQNSYFWMLCGLVADETGQDKEDIKDQLMHAMGHYRQKVVNGKPITVFRSTTTLSREEFGELIGAAQQLCEGLEIRYPLPAHYGYDF